MLIDDDAFFGIEGHVALDGYPILAIDSRKSFKCKSHRQFHTLSGLLDSIAALQNPYHKAFVPSREAVCTIL